MKLKELEQFLKDCIKKEIAFPRNTMVVLVEDFYEAIPIEHHESEDLEYNVRVEQEFAKVIIKPLKEIKC
jgi:hypothetical protein